MRALGIFVGGPVCNAKCSMCAGVQHRKYAPIDGAVDDKRMIEVLEFASRNGAKYVSISSSGEPTLFPDSVKRTLDLISKYEFTQVNLYSNGIRIAKEPDFIKTLLEWKLLGLTNVYVTVHSADHETNKKGFGVVDYPETIDIMNKIISVGLQSRFNVPLRKGFTDTVQKLERIVSLADICKVSSISAWPVRGNDDKIDELLSPSVDILDKMKNVKGVNLHWPIDQSQYDSAEKMTLFPDGSLRNNWCK